MSQDNGLPQAIQNAMEIVEDTLGGADYRTRIKILAWLNDRILTTLDENDSTAADYLKRFGR